MKKTMSIGRKSLIAVALAGAVILVVLPTVSAYDDFEGPGHPTDTGEWQSTGYAASAPNSCNAAAGEQCKEWCARTPNDNLVPTGNLCCVVDQNCVDEIRN